MLTFQGLRQTIAARITANMSGWVESDMPLEMFGSDPATVAHKRFACWLPQGQDTNNVRGVVSEGSRVAQNLTVRFSWKVPPKDKIAAYDLGLEDMRKLYAVLIVHGDGWPGQIGIIGENWSTSTLDGGEYYIFDVNFLIYFQLDLTA